MRPKGHCVLKLVWGATALGVLAWPQANAWAQRTEVHDAGAGRKVEVIYNSAGQVIENRTIDAAGKLQVRAVHEYHPGHLVPDHTTTTYWPDGKTPQSLTTVSYDANGNFTAEAITLYGQTGKQSGGSRLDHDPLTGIYRCSQWSAATHGYQPSECPVTEGEGGAGEEPKALTYEEVMRQLEAARAARRTEQKAERMERKTPIRPPITTAQRTVGVILPAQLARGERVSGSVVEDPERYEGRPDLSVFRLELPFASQGEAASLRGWAFAAAGQEEQRADGPVSFTVPQTAEFTVTLREDGDPAVSASRQMSSSAPAGPSTTGKFESAALCLKGDLCAVHGPLGGDSTKTFAAFGSQPAPIVAETEDTAYVAVPESLEPGAAHLLIAEGSVVAALPVDVADLSFSPRSQDVVPGQDVLVHATLEGPEEMAEELWRPGVAPGVSLERARKFDPDFDPAKDGKKGVLLLALWNAKPEGVSLRSAKNGVYALKLTADSFERGEFRYQFVVEPTKPSAISLAGTVLTFVAPVTGEQFTVKP